VAFFKFTKPIFYFLFCIFVTIWATSGCSQPEITNFITFAPAKSENTNPNDLLLAQEILQVRLDSSISGIAEVHIDENALEVGLSNSEDKNMAIELTTNIGEIIFFHSDISLEVGELPPSNATIIFTDLNIKSVKIR